ncbi:unnamed protein product [Paramecium octaurelia]|uniref:Uncharacterized protein n=1 Tax=Paramecium octaurelia TaxID=43137 RepID=A0A8S1XBZ3_PAROT|nr:unnamed protein product [Paramecium octaurelia]
MNYFLDCNQVCNAFHGSEKESEQYNQQLFGKDVCCCNRVKDYNYSYWDSNQERLVKVPFQMLLTKEKHIKYIIDGQIVRIDKFINRDEELNNIEQIKYLLWKGSYNQSYNKVAKWSAIWNGDQLLEVGGYYSVDSLKQGFWKELSRNYFNQNQVYECGEYKNGLRIQKWKYMYENKIIGGGYYNEAGMKKGKWVDLSFDFWSQCQVTYCGEYLDGKKVGLWDIFYKRIDELRLIGGGSYVLQKDGGDFNSKKIGIWTELANGFQDNNQTIWRGEYKNDQKVGKWAILRRLDQSDPFQYIGGGSYDYKSEDSCVVDSIKIGNWIEFRSGQQDCYVTQGGQYIKGKKVGRWESFIQGELIGGGSYDADSQNEESLKDPIKFGKWIELSEGFQIDSEVTYHGVYQNGRKVGKWDTFYQDEQIGGGSYGENSASSQIKLGKWIELSDCFWGGGQIIFNGEYHDGKKIGRWYTLYRRWKKDSFEEIGGGSYDCEERGSALGSLKIGSWVELSPDFCGISQITYNGDYQNGYKVGNWVILYRKHKYKRYKQIGGGQYDNCRIYSLLNQNKIGKWIELNDLYIEGRRIKYVGEYKNGRKFSRWNTIFEKELIGGGDYSEDDKFQGSIKTGKWIELIGKFGNGYGYSQSIFVGDYKHGKKVGAWKQMIRNEKNKETEFKQITELKYEY